MGFPFRRKVSVPAPDPTAVGAALCRLLEQAEPVSKRLFRDPVVESLLGPRARPALSFGTAEMMRGQIDGTAPGLYGSQICRTRYIDDAVLDALGHDISQVAIVGAGYDTRAYRLPGIDKARVAEFDLPATLNHKRQAVEKRFGRLPERVSYTDLDLESAGVATAFSDAGIATTERTAVVCEGVTQYISASAVNRLLAAVGALCSGSELVLTYVVDSTIRERDGIAQAAQALARGGPKWVFGIAPSRVPSLLREFGLEVIEDVGAQELQERYLAPLGRRLAVSPYERIVRAVVGAANPA